MEILSPQHPKNPKPLGVGKYPHLVEQLTVAIRAGRWSAGERLPTFVELQATFGVTPHTVNRAMIALEQEGLVERRRGNGVFVADSPARRVGSGIIGLSGYGFGFTGQSSYWANLLRGMREVIDAAEQQILLLPHTSSNGWEKSDGVLLCDQSPQSLSLVPAQLPCVSVLLRQEGLSSVSADDNGGARAATQHLLDLGHRRIAFLHSRNLSITPQRLAAYRETLHAADIAQNPRWLQALPTGSDYGEHFGRAGRESLRRWIAEDWREMGCTALLAHNDETAWGAIEAFEEAGLSVPGDVSVVGFDGVDREANGNGRQLATVEVPLREIGAKAAQMLLRQIAADEVTIENQVLPVKFCAGDTTAPPHASAQKN